MQQFTNHKIDLSSLPTYQHLELESIDPAYWRIILFNIIVFFVLVFGGAGFVILETETSRPLFWLFLSATLFLFLLTIWSYRISLKRRGFALRDKDIVYKSGLIAETTTIVPLKNIQHIELNEGWLSRILKLGRLEVFTAGGGAGHLRISGIPIENAKILKEALLRQVDHLTIDHDATV